MMDGYGFNCILKGVSVSIHEMNCLARRFEAIQDKRLDEEHRLFLSELVFDERGLPYYQGNVAGIDACYSLRKK